ncbi:hypothetical protein BIW11_11211, partial [Tropilaelaps mercedesae]
MAGLQHSSSGARADVAMGEEDDDLEALRVAALAALEAKRLKEVPRNKIVQRNNVLVIQPTDDLLPRLDHPVRTARSPSPRVRRKSPKEPSPLLRRRSPSLRLSHSPRRYSPRRSVTPRGRSPRFRSRTRSRSPRCRYRSPLPPRRSPRRSSRSPSPRRISLSPRRRSPLRRRSPVARRSPKRRSPLLRTPPRRSPLRRSPPRKATNGEAPRRNNAWRSPSRRMSRSPIYRNGPVEPKKQAEHVPAPVFLRNRSHSLEQKDRFSRFQDGQDNDSEDDSCNESLLDEILKDSHLDVESGDNDGAEVEKRSTQTAEPSAIADDAKENTVKEEPDEDCLLLQVDDDMDDLLELEEDETLNAKEPSKPVVVKEKKPLKEQRRIDEQKRTDRRRDERASRRENKKPDPSERERRDRKETRSRREKEVKTLKAEKKVEKEKESKRHKEKNKELVAEKVVKSDKVKEEPPVAQAVEEKHKPSTPTGDITPEQRQRFEARKRKFECTEIKHSKKVISLKKDGSDIANGDGGVIEEGRTREPASGGSSRKGGIQERLGAKELRSSKVRANPRGEKPSGAEEDVV